MDPTEEPSVAVTGVVASLKGYRSWSSAEVDAAEVVLAALFGPEPWVKTEGWLLDEVVVVVLDAALGCLVGRLFCACRISGAL